MPRSFWITPGLPRSLYVPAGNTTVGRLPRPQLPPRLSRIRTRTKVLPPHAGAPEHRPPLAHPLLPRPCLQIIEPLPHLLRASSIGLRGLRPRQAQRYALRRRHLMVFVLAGRNRRKTTRHRCREAPTIIALWSSERTSKGMDRGTVAHRRPAAGQRRHLYGVQHVTLQASKQRCQLENLDIEALAHVSVRQWHRGP